MEEQLKQRLIGAIVVVTFIVIFVPMIFDGGDVEKVASNTAVPVPADMEIDELLPPVSELENISWADDPTVLEGSGEAAQAPKPEAIANTQHIEQGTTQQSGGQAKKSATTTDKQAAHKTVTTTAKQIAKSGHSVGTAWSVQLGAFGDAKNAKAFQQNLIQKGYTAYVKELHRNGKHLSVVYIGPELHRSDALKLAGQVKEKFHIKAFVVNYHPAVG